MESFFGSPWDFGTGFTAPFGTGGESFLPQMPQMDLPSMFANGLAAQGIRPAQFFANPQLGASVLNPSPQQPNVWDPTPVATPGGEPTMLPGTPGRGPNPNVQTDDIGGGASAEGSEEERRRAGRETMADRFAKGLRGVRMPEPPKPQTVRTPDAPRPGAAIKSGEILQLLLAAMQGGGAGGAAGLKLPATLGGALQGAFR